MSLIGESRDWTHARREQAMKRRGPVYVTLPAPKSEIIADEIEAMDETLAAEEAKIEAVIDRLLNLME